MGGRVKELLMRWWKLEPQRCKWSDDSYRESFHVLYKGDIEEVWIEGGEFDEAYIQAAVQEAVTARSWMVDLVIFGDGSSTAYLYPTSDMGRALNREGSIGDSPAETLLRSYLQALEAQ
jgi:hypothetical protein